MERNLKKAAAQLGLTHAQLIAQMRGKGLLNEYNLPAYPTRDREYLRVKDGRWWHPELGMQYSQSTRVKQAGIAWLAGHLGVELPPPPEDPRDVA